MLFDAEYPYLSADWQSAIKDRFYDEKSAEVILFVEQCSLRLSSHGSTVSFLSLFSRALRQCLYVDRVMYSKDARNSQQICVIWIGFCHTGPISLCIDLFVFICAYFVCFCFILHSCGIIVSTVEWTWWDWGLILRTYLTSVLWHCWLGHLTRKNPSPIWPIMSFVWR